MSFGKGEGEWGEIKTQIQVSSCLLHWSCTVSGSSVFSAGEVHCACPLFPSDTSPKAGLDLEACLKWETWSYLANKFVLLKCWRAEAMRRWGAIPCSALLMELMSGTLICDQVLSFVWFWWAAGSTRDSKSAFPQHLLHHGTEAWKSRCLKVKPLLGRQNRYFQCYHPRFPGTAFS